MSGTVVAIMLIWVGGYREGGPQVIEFSSLVLCEAARPVVVGGYRGIRGPYADVKATCIEVRR